MTHYDSNNYKIKKYWPNPSLMQYSYTYQSVNDDIKLQKDVTEYFYNKLLVWIHRDNSKFNKFKSLGLDSNKGKKFIYKLLKKFIIKSNINWYDLRDNHYLIKKYIYIKLKDLNN